MSVALFILNPAVEYFAPRSLHSNFDFFFRSKVGLVFVKYFVKCGSSEHVILSLKNAILPSHTNQMYCAMYIVQCLQSKASSQNILHNLKLNLLWFCC